MQANTVVAASAARTVTGSAQINTGPSKGGHFVFDITAFSGTAPTVTFTISGVDTVSGKTYTLLVSAALNTVSTTVLKVFPGATVAANLAANDVLPGQLLVTWTIAGTTPSFTFSAAFLPAND